MTRFKNLFVAAFAVALVALIAGAVPAAAQTVHFVGAGSSAQFTMAAIAADQAAIAEVGGPTSSNVGNICHWSIKSSGNQATGHQSYGAYLQDKRDSLNRIQDEPGNIWIVWLENSGNAACGSGSLTDIWLAVSVDSTVGVRCFSAVQPGGTQGCYAYDVDVAGTLSGGPSSGGPGKSVSASLWPDKNSDAVLDQAVVNLITPLSNTTPLQVNVGLTDIRPEDALFATERAMAALNTTTWAGLGYVGPTANIGSAIQTAQGTGTTANPVMFALAGKADPFKTGTVSTYTTYPIGAAPVVFIMNNGLAGSYPTNLVTGVTPGVAAGPYSLAKLFDGTTSCDTDNAAFGGNNDGKGTPLTLFLREPLSGTMNTAEFNLFRSTGNTNDSQEVGVVDPTRSGYNPLNLNCNGAGKRERAIGTSEVVGKSATYGLLGNANSLGYIFTGWSNLAKFAGAATYNYLTLDGVDPLFSAPGAYSTCQGGTSPNNDGQACGTNEPCTATGSGVAGTCTAVNNNAQTVPYCGSTLCTADLWSGNNSFPNIRNGSYKAWSIYRWIANSGNTDPYGPVLVAQEAQNNVGSDIADFVPFSACPAGDGQSCFTTNGGNGPVDGLTVYRSHFVPSGIKNVTANNGSATEANSFNGGNTLGGGTEAGGDVGGLVYGPFGVQGEYTGTVTTSGTLTKGKGYKVTYKAGTKFTAGSAWEGGSITINGVAYTVADVAVTTSTLYVTTNPGANTAVSYSITESLPLATTPGTLKKHQ
jgi:hypothetical protein